MIALLIEFALRVYQDRLDLSRLESIREGRFPTDC